MQAQLCESYNTFQERVEVWRFLCAEGIRDELQNDSRDGVGRIAYEEEMRVFKRDVEVRWPRALSQNPAKGSTQLWKTTPRWFQVLLFVTNPSRFPFCKSRADT